MRHALPVIVVLLSLAPLAHAHRGSAKLVTVERTSDGAVVDVELESVDVAVSLGMDEDAPPEEVLARDAAIRAWLERGFSVRGAGGACSLHAEAPEGIEVDGQPRVRVRLVAECPSEASGLVLEDGTIFGDDAQHEAFVRVRWAEQSDAHVLRAGRQSLRLSEPPAVSSLLARFLWEGVRHLATGYDHVLFLLSLILTAGGMARREGLRAAAKDVAWIVTAFTLGHSVTLIAAALGWVVLPSRLVESVIAGSIVVVALLNLARPEKRASMPWLAFAFGLVHGFGFSGVLAELGLPAQARVLSLVAFNVGIELAQLAFVAALLVPLERAARWTGYERWIVQGGSGVIATLAGFWLLERSLF